SPDPLSRSDSVRRVQLNLSLPNSFCPIEWNRYGPVNRPPTQSPAVPCMERDSQLCCGNACSIYVTEYRPSSDHCMAPANWSTATLVVPARLFFPLLQFFF